LPVLILLPVAVLASAISGVLGMGGGSVLLAVMASGLDPAVVVPVHGVVQMVSNSTRTFVLLKDVAWKYVALYVPAMVAGVWIGLQLYSGAGMSWFKPAIGVFIFSFLAWDAWKPKHLELPDWSYVPAGLGGGLLTITLGAAGPYLSAFFLRRDLSKEKIIATKAAIQTIGHFLKIPAFLSVGFDYRGQLALVAPLLVGSIAGTMLGTWILKRVDESKFRTLFRGVLAVLALRLVVSPWIEAGSR
jgi:uncharacterized membrane protein YfcA